MAHLERGKVIVVGPNSQVVLRPWLNRNPESCCLIPAGISAWSYRRLQWREPSRDGTRDDAAGPSKLAPGQRYTRHSYRITVQRAYRRAGILAWSPRQLRHTQIRDSWPVEGGKISPKRSD